MTERCENQGSSTSMMARADLVVAVIGDATSAVDVDDHIELLAQVPTTARRQVPTRRQPGTRGDGGKRMPPNGMKASAAQRISAERVLDPVGETWATPARRPGPGAEVGQPAVVGLNAGPAPLVVALGRGSATRLPSSKNGGTVFGKSTSAMMPSDSFSARRRSESQLRYAVGASRSAKGFT